MLLKCSFMTVLLRLKDWLKFKEGITELQQLLSVSNLIQLTITGFTLNGDVDHVLSLSFVTQYSNYPLCAIRHCTKSTFPKNDHSNLSTAIWSARICSFCAGKYNTAVSLTWLRIRLHHSCKAQNPLQITDGWWRYCCPPSAAGMCVCVYTNVCLLVQVALVSQIFIFRGVIKKMHQGCHKCLQ